MENGKRTSREWCTDGRTTIGKGKNGGGRREEVEEMLAFDTTRVGRLPYEI